jgi:imidazolonepropionase-like amidohydrolase
MKYMPKATLNAWRKVKKQYMEDPSWDPEQWKAFDALRLELIRRLAAEGHGLLLGSDAPQVFNVPGFSLKHEMAGMRRAGLSPSEILRMGTLHPAQFFGQESEWGSLEEGKAADLFLVEGNPLEDLSALETIHGVMLRGRWIPREELDRKLQEIAANAAADDPGGQD